LLLHSFFSTGFYEVSNFIFNVKMNILLSLKNNLNILTTLQLKSS
jgi:hypothetical protein